MRLELLHARLAIERQLPVAVDVEPFSDLIGQGAKTGHQRRRASDRGGVAELPGNVGGLVRVGKQSGRYLGDVPGVRLEVARGPRLARPPPAPGG